MEAKMDVNVPESMTPWLRADVDVDVVVVETFVPVADQLTVGEVASLVGVSVRTLHHWDAVSLVRPHDRTPGGYRAYSPADVERVHRVLIYRELGLSLARIGSLLDDPDVDQIEQLRQQQSLLHERIGKLQRMADAIDQVIASRAAGMTLTAQQQADIFGQGWREDWAGEAKERWGESDEWAQFEQNAARFSENDRKRIQAAGEALYGEMVEAKRSSVAPGSVAAHDLVERHRAMVGQLFDCTHSMQVCLGQLYVNDDRFGDYFSDLEPGLADWLAEAINENARRVGVDPARAVWE